MSKKLRMRKDCQSRGQIGERSSPLTVLFPPNEDLAVIAAGGKDISVLWMCLL